MNRHERRKAAAQLKAQPSGVPGVLILDRREVPEGTCDQCKASNEELRPYGPEGQWICFDCAMKDEPGTARRYRQHVFGESTS